MTKNEVVKVLSTIKIAFPNSFRNMTDADAKALVKLWKIQFADYEYKDVMNALNCIISTDTSGFMPVIGQIKEMIVKLNTPEQMTEIEAWGYVKKALRNSGYHAEEEFKKLPPLVQRLVGSPQQLFDWAMTNSEQVDTVIASNFQRSFKVRAKHEMELLAMPRSVLLDMQDKGLLKVGDFMKIDIKDGMLSFGKIEEQ